MDRATLQLPMKSRGYRFFERELGVNGAYPPMNMGDMAGEPTSTATAGQQPRRRGRCAVVATHAETGFGAHFFSVLGL